MDQNKIEKGVRLILEGIGEDPDREGLVETPSRVAKAYEKICGGYEQAPEEVLSKRFTVERYNELVLMKDISFYSMCEHHMLPFFGKCHIGYIPTKKVVGASKLIRVLEVFARRLQIQERLTEEVAEAIQDIVKPRAVGVVIEAVHLCVACRGVEKQSATFVTSALRGGFFKNPSARLEFLSLLRKN